MYFKYSDLEKLTIGDGIGLATKYIEISTFTFPFHTFQLTNMHAPSIFHNLLLTPKFAQDNNWFFELHHSYCHVKDHLTKTLKGLVLDGIYCLYGQDSSTKLSKAPFAWSSSRPSLIYGTVISVIYAAMKIIRSMLSTSSIFLFSL